MHISRRAFVRATAAYVAASATMAIAACALPRQGTPPTLRRIGFLLTNPVSDSAAVEHMDAFRQGLRELGHIDGETIVIDIRSAEGDPARFPALAAELVASSPEVVVAVDEAPALAEECALTVPERARP